MTKVMQETAGGFTVGAVRAMGLHAQRTGTTSQLREWGYEVFYLWTCRGAAWEAARREAA